MYSFLDLLFWFGFGSVVSCPVLTVASWPAYRFLRRQVRWSDIPISKNFPQFVVIHTVKGFSIVNEAEVFLEFSCFFYDPTDVGNLISGSSAFSKSSLNVGNSQFTYCWSLAWRILSTTLLTCAAAAECNCAVVGTLFGTALLWDWNKNWTFSVLWPLLSFPNWNIYVDSKTISL